MKAQAMTETPAFILEPYDGIQQTLPVPIIFEDTALPNAACCDVVDVRFRGLACSFRHTVNYSKRSVVVDELFGTPLLLTQASSGLGLDLLLEVSGRHERMPDGHARSGIAHDALYLTLCISPLAMGGAVLAVAFMPVRTRSRAFQGRLDDLAGILGTWHRCRGLNRRGSRGNRCFRWPPSWPCPW